MKWSIYSKLSGLTLIVGLALAVFAPMGERRPYYIGLLVLSGLDLVLESRLGPEREARTRGNSFAMALLWVICLTGTIGDWLPSDPKTAALLVLNLTKLGYFVGVFVALAARKRQSRNSEG